MYYNVTNSSKIHVILSLILFFCVHERESHSVDSKFLEKGQNFFWNFLSFLLMDEMVTIKDDNFIVWDKVLEYVSLYVFPCTSWIKPNIFVSYH